MTEIHLSRKDRLFLLQFVKKGIVKARELARANALLLADEGQSEEYISNATRLHRQSVWRTKKKYLDVGLPKALQDNPRSGQPKKYDERDEAEIIALACSNAPHGRNRWTVRLLAEELRQKKGLESINRESVRLILKKRNKALAEKNVVHRENNSGV